METSGAKKQIVAVIGEGFDTNLAVSLLKERFTVVATSYNKAMVVVQDCQPHAIVCAALPEVADTSDLHTEVIRKFVTKDIAPLVLLGPEDSDTEVQSYQMGATDYIPAPFTYERLVTRVGTVAACDALRRRLVDSERLITLGTMIASIAHEIKNPVNAATNAVLALKRSGATITKDKVFVALDSSVQRIAEITDAITEQSRPIQRKANCDLRQCIDSVLLLLSYKTINIDFNVTVEGEHRLQIPRGRLEQVFINIIDNAILSGAKKLTIAASKESAAEIPSIVVSIQDDGPGISPEVAHKMFSTFFTTRGDDGTGLGLAICRQILRRIDGDIWHKNVSGSAGSTFYIKVPLVV